MRKTDNTWKETLSSYWKKEAVQRSWFMRMWQVPRWAGCVPRTDGVWICLHCLQTERDYVPCVDQASLHRRRRPAGTRLKSWFYSNHIECMKDLAAEWRYFDSKISILKMSCGYLVMLFSYLSSKRKTYIVLLFWKRPQSKETHTKKSVQ